MKIVYCINSIRVLGGIERVTMVKANALAEVPGNEVYIAVLTDKKGCYTEVPSPKVKVVDLDAEFSPMAARGAELPMCGNRSNMPRLINANYRLFCMN